MDLGMILDLATLVLAGLACWRIWQGRGEKRPPGGDNTAPPPPDPGQTDEERRLREGFANLMAYRGPVTDKEERE